MKHVIVWMIMFFTFGNISVFSQTEIITIDDLANHSALSGSVYILNSGNYTLTTSGINISSDARNRLEIVNVDTTLSVANTLTQGTIFTLNQLKITNGILSSAGGGADNTRGIDTTSGEMLQAGGNVVAQGGSGTGAHGIYTNRLTQTDGSLRATGGSNTSYGVRAVHLTQTGGNISGSGGSGTGSDGIRVDNGSFIQDNEAVLTATGGTGTNATGFRIINGNFTQNNGQVTATGGSGNNANGIWISGSGLFQNGGTITTTGSLTKNNVHGIRIDSHFTQTNGALTAKGGDFASSNGMIVLGNFTQIGGTINATGGGAQFAYGISAIYNPLIQNGGSIFATGGSNHDAHGISVSALVQNQGNITAVGSDGSLARGISTGSITQTNGTIVAQGGSYGNASSASIALYSSGTFTQNGGNVVTTGGTGENSRGLYVNTLIQNQGGITATGGAAAGSHGLDAGTINQTNGMITATGGSSDPNSYGIRVRSSFFADGPLRLERQGEAASVFLAPSASMTFGPHSHLVPVVDLNQPDNLASGLIETSDGMIVTIENGSTVTPWFTNTRTLTKGAVRTIDFINTNGGSIDGVFSQMGNGVTLEYTIEKLDSDSRYVITIERRNNMEDILSLIPCENSKNLIGILDDYLTAHPNAAPLDEIWTLVDNSQDNDELRKNAAYIGLSTTPQAYTKLTQSFFRLANLTNRNIVQQLTLDDRTEASNARDNDVICEPCCHVNFQDSKKRHFWISPFYLKSDRFAPKCYEFDDAREMFTGVSVGSGRRYGKLSLGAAFHYLSGNYNASFSDIDFDSYGFHIAGRLQNSCRGEKINPWLNVTAGYTHSEIDQRNRDFSGLWKTSSPHAHLVQSGFQMGYDRKIGKHLAVSPNFGLHYVHIHQSGYEESNTSGFGLKVYGNRFNSLRPSVGMDWKTHLNEKLIFSGRVHYRYEALDKYSKFQSEFSSFPDFKFPTHGENLNRSSGDFGFGMNYNWRKHISLMANYDALFQDKYFAHQLIGSFVLAF